MNELWIVEWTYHGNAKYQPRLDMLYLTEPSAEAFAAYMRVESPHMDFRVRRFVAAPETQKEARQSHE